MILLMEHIKSLNQLFDVIKITEWIIIELNLYGYFVGNKMLWFMTQVIIINDKFINSFLKWNSPVSCITVRLMRMDWWEWIDENGLMRMDWWEWTDENQFPKIVFWQLIASKFK